MTLNLQVTRDKYVYVNLCDRITNLRFTASGQSLRPQRSNKCFSCCQVHHTKLRLKKQLFKTYLKCMILSY